MVTHDDYVAGWVNLSVNEFLNAFPQTYERLRFCLITCVDSNKSPVSLLQSSPELEYLRTAARPFGHGLLLPTNKLLESRGRHRIFFGFDEVWFFPNEPLAPKPDTAWLVGPARVEERTLRTLGSWMTDNSCSLALGGGAGLNFIVKARGLVRYLIGFSNAQPKGEEILNSIEYDTDIMKSYSP